jgi:hypothetical protein
MTGTVLRGNVDAANSAAFSPDGPHVVTAGEDRPRLYRQWHPKGNILQVVWVSLEGVTEYPLTFDRPICATDPPPPDLAAEPGAAKPP